MQNDHEDHGLFEHPPERVPEPDEGPQVERTPLKPDSLPPPKRQRSIEPWPDCMLVEAQC